MNVFWNVAEALGLGTPKFRTEEIRFNAINELHESLSSGANNIAETCVNFANHFNNVEQKYDACCGTYDCEPYDFKPINDNQDNESMFSGYGNLILLGLMFLALMSMAIFFLKRRWAIQDGYSDLGVYCSLKGKEHGKKTALTGFTVYFEEILNKYDGINGVLSTGDRTHLETTLKSLLKYYFWKNNKTPTEMDMRTGLYQKLSLMFHPDKAARHEHATLIRFNALMGAGTDSICKLVNEVKQQQPKFADNPEGYQADQKYLKVLPTLTEALRVHGKIKPELEDIHIPCNEFDDFGVWDEIPDLLFSGDINNSDERALVLYNPPGDNRSEKLQNHLFGEVRYV